MAHDLPHALTIEQVNALDDDGFVLRFGAVFEASPHLAGTAARARPFEDRAALLAAFDQAAEALDDGAVLALLRAHPVLGNRGPMAVASQREQAGAGLDTIDDQRRMQIAIGNEQYLNRFGFPFIVAVRDLDVADIAAALAARLDNPAGVERVTAFQQVRRIAALRIEQAVQP